jgi:ATP-dependent DNA helicase RecQ
VALDLDAVTFLDVEATRAGRVLVVGAVRASSELRVRFDSADERRRLGEFIGTGAVAGHNLTAFDLPLLGRERELDLGENAKLDTLWLSMLADPLRRSHALEKVLVGALPDPVADAKLSRARAAEALEVLADLDLGVARVHAALFRAAGQVALADALYEDEASSLSLAAAAEELPETLLARLCRVNLGELIRSLDAKRPKEHVALSLALRFVEVAGFVREDVESEGRESRLGSVANAAFSALPRFTEMVRRLLGPLCPDPTCAVRARCDVHRPFAEEILARHFELPGFRPHQKEIVLSVLDGRAPLAILPTGGGKSLCYQLPAVHGATRLRGLTVVVSPLQALMADQVRALSTRYPGTCYVNSSLLLVDRRDNLDAVRIGRSDILYMGPEQLRNPGILRLLRARPPFLWVIDEAHCISAWGHGFRTDYTHLPRAIRNIHGDDRAPLIALFTATATAEVIEDISLQMKRALDLQIEVNDFGTTRDNLAFEVVSVSDEAQKDRALENLLSAIRDGSRLVYRSTVRGASELCAKLRERGIACALYHGRLSPKEKAEQLDRFLSGHARTVVATSAFGMGIDKPDIRLVVHYDLPGSLEDYMQEAGRAGRDGQPARCVLLHDEADLETQFFLKTQSRVTRRDVRYVFVALRARARRLPRDEVGKVELWVSPEELFVEEHLEEALDWAREELGTKLKLVLHHLEADGVLERRENRTRVFGLTPNLASFEAASALLPAPASPVTLRVLAYVYDAERPRMVSILDVAEVVGITPKEAFREIHALSEKKIIGQELAFDVMLARGVPRATEEQAQRWFALIDSLFGLGAALGSGLTEAPVIELRATSAELGRRVSRSVAPHELFQLLSALRRLRLLRLEKAGPSRFRLRFDPDFLGVRDRLRELRRTADGMLSWLDRRLEGKRGRDLRIDLDVNQFLGEYTLLDQSFASDLVVEAALLLHHLEAWHLSDPPVLFEIAMKVRFDPKKTLADLHPERADRQHEHEISLVHLLREYAVLPDTEKRNAYVADYFRLRRAELTERWFRGRKKRITRPVGPGTEADIVRGLSAAQAEAVTSEDDALLVIAGPGSGKTHTVVRRIAYMVRARQIRPNEILVLAFSRAAAAELRRRLGDSLGDRGRAIEVRTFHSLALKLTGDDLRDESADSETRLAQAMRRAAELLSAAGDDEKDSAEELRRRALGPIRHVLVDEYQDLDPDQYALLAALVGLTREAPPGERVERSVFVVGDDDQALYGFRDARVEFLQRFEAEFSARRVCLVENFRSARPITEAASRFVARIPERMKREAREQVIPAPTVAAGDENSVRRFLHADSSRAAAHVVYAIRRTLEDETSGSVAVIARYWADLDGVRGALEDAKVPFVIHHAQFHRPAHRRHPAAKVLRELWKKPVNVEGHAEDFVRVLAEEWKRETSEPSLAELLAAARTIDQDRVPLEALEGAPALLPIGSVELADALLLASRESALGSATAVEGARVHLCTFHGAKGLEFDKVFVLPARAGASGEADELRAYYVAMSRARRELVLVTLGKKEELAQLVECPEHDMRSTGARLGSARGRYFDCTPKDVRLQSPELAGSRFVIEKIREGAALTLDASEKRLRFLWNERLVAELSIAGQERFESVFGEGKCGAELRAHVHEIFVHLLRTAPNEPAQGSVNVVLPTIRWREV